MKSIKAALRTVTAGALSIALLWLISLLSGAPLYDPSSMQEMVLYQLRSQLPADLSPAAALTVSHLPYLPDASETLLETERDTQTVITAPALSPIPQAAPTTLAFLDNGVPAQTVRVTDPKGYTTVGSVYIKNSSGKTVDTDAAAAFTPPAVGDGPQVLILHTHGSEAYTLPAGQTYVSTGNYRTSDTSCSVVRVGDEIAAVLSSYGISVLHDRTLYDDPLYNDAYSRSLAGAEAYLEKYPSLYYILDIHRDAVEDGNHNQYKLVSAEDETVAQLSFVIGANHERWQENLSLAVAVTETVQSQHPTAMRPIILRASRYNQHLSPGALLLEVGAAGNSLDEALHASRIFADALAEVILTQ